MKKKLKNKSRIIAKIILILPINIILAILCYCAYTLIYDSIFLPDSYEKKIMKYDLGNNKKITLLKNDDFIYIIPYDYNKKIPPKEDYIKAKIDNIYYKAYLLFENDSTIIFKGNYKYLINLKKFKCKTIYELSGWKQQQLLSYKYDKLFPTHRAYKRYDNYNSECELQKSLSYLDDELPPTHRAYKRYDNYNNKNKLLRDSLLLIPRFEFSINHKPLKVHIRRVNNNRVTFHSYLGIEEQEDEMYVIKE